jgi:alkyl sulfatase BDS1-like metallo-beta-lactamase superfamily hydrolase
LFQGLTSIQFDDDVPVSETSVSLVSRGAECIMLSKQFFMRHANERVRMELRRQVRPYPTADTFQENLQIKVDWDNYRKELLKDITTQQELQSASRKTAR